MQEERIYRLLFENSAQGMVLRQGETTILVNQSFAEMVGYTIEELLGFSFEEALTLIHPEERDWVAERLRNLLAGIDLQNHYEYRFLRRNGETGWCSATVSVIDYRGQPAVLGTYLDITERKQAEESIQRERQLLANILDALPIGVCLNDETGHYRLANDAYYRIYEFEPGEIIGKHYTTIMPPDQVEVANQHFARILGGDLAIPTERKRQRKDGSIVYIEAANALVKYADDQKSVITVVRDISERKQMEISLRASEERFRTLIDEAPIAILLITMAGQVKLANQRAESLFGYDALALQDISLDQLIPQIYRGAHPLQIEDLLRSIPRERPRMMAMEIDSYGLRADGTQFPADITLGHIHLKDEMMVLAFAFDAAERLELEQQRLALRLEQERSSILASFMQNAAHEFRTPLSVIKTSAYLLNKAQTDAQKESCNEQITSQIDALVRLVSQLSVLSRLTHINETKTKTEFLELNAMLDRVIATHQARCSNGQISIRMESDHERIYVEGTRDDLNVAFSEILDNAIRYSSEGGQISVHLCTVTSGQVLITIQDTGQGMSEETQRRAFERFYREDSAHSTRGFGLGLPIARQIFELHGGSITCESVIDMGTTVQVYLPYVSM